MPNQPLNDPVESKADLGMTKRQKVEVAKAAAAEVARLKKEEEEKEAALEAAEQEKERIA